MDNPYSNEMTLRDYFAGKAMQAAITNEKLRQGMVELSKDYYKDLSKSSYEVAEAMLKEREKFNDKN